LQSQKGFREGEAPAEPIFRLASIEALLRLGGSLALPSKKAFANHLIHSRQSTFPAFLPKKYQAAYKLPSRKECLDEKSEFSLKKIKPTRQFLPI
jgi:hypothetical protein